MNSFIVISSNQKALEEEIQKRLDKANINNFDVLTIESEKAIGIEEVRFIQ